MAPDEPDPLQRFPLYLVAAREPDGPVYLLTFLTREELERIGGLAPHAIVGKVFDPEAGIEPDNFARNRAFVDFMHGVIRRVVPTIPAYVEAAAEAGEGLIHVHDGRSIHAHGGEPDVDIIGSFEVSGGRIVADSYAPDPHHWILNENGIFTPHPAIQEAILAALRDGTIAR